MFRGVERGADVANSKKKYPSKYESRIWSSAEKKYDATKQKCWRVLKALKKIRY